MLLNDIEKSSSGGLLYQLHIKKIFCDVSIISHQKYVKYTDGEMEIYCMSSEYSKFSDHVKTHEITQLALIIQKRISEGIFVLVNSQEIIIGGALFDTSLCWSKLDGTMVVSDSAWNIAQYFNLDISKVAVALNLISSLPYYPFQNVSMWENVEKVQPFCVLKNGKNQTFEEVKIWDIPDLNHDMDLTLKNIREGFLEVIRSSNRYANVSADLSGGVDSASVAYLLKFCDTDVKLYHTKTDNSWNSDSKWAASFAEDMNIPLNTLSSLGESGKRYDIDTPYSGSKLPDHPIFWADTEGYVEKIVSLKENPGNSIHFTGLGGDELFTPMPAYAWTLVRQNKLRSLSLGFRYCLISRISFLKGMSDLINNMPFKEAIKSEIGIGFGYNKSNKKDSALAWSGKINVPAWINQDSLSLSHKAAVNAVDKISGGLDSDRSKHQALESLLFQTRVIGQLNLIYGEEYKWKSPFLDTKIIESALSIPMRHHLKSEITKPMLHKATVGIVPSEVFTRGFKGDYSTALYKGYKEAVNEIISIVKDLNVVKLGVVDPDILVSELSMPTALHNRVIDFERLCAVERWLKNTIDFKKTAKVVNI
ncbi:asparagine synthase C-terminal domain-containing protein [Paenibacillus sp. FSL K6-2393]|uniref:asparagine synthase C-terminal domain-containing protein n=1 Tax=Paenibacillus sp. FSL K6-2393 TaxID=2921475 RepID=UPI0030FAB6EF